MLQCPGFAQLETAQSWNETGRRQFEQGQPELALLSWQKAEKQYRDRKDQPGILGSQLNQAKALEALGFYRRAQKLLEQLTATQQPDSTLRANQFLALGKNLRLIGDFAGSQQALEKSLDIAQKVTSNSDVQAALLQLGNTAIAQQQFEPALSLFQQATTYEANLQCAAALQQIKALQKLGRIPEAVALMKQLQTKLTELPPTQQTLYERIELATLASNHLDSAKLLAITIQAARQLKNKRVESYALGTLAHLYEQSKQWSDAAQLTKQALRLATQLNIPEISYQWQWQLGRILKAQNKTQPAAIAYLEAIDSLKTLRRDIAAIDQSIQFSFREQIEPVYREFVDLLLVEQTSQENLKKARQVIESLQVAELNNFFREACLNTSTEPIESIDPTAAVIYPIILPNRLEVILSLPNQPLKHFTTARSQSEVEDTIFKMRQSLRPTSFEQERLPLAQTLYSWLIQPAKADLEKNQIKTIAFVLDGSLRNIPMAALYNGQRYLIEDYQIAVTPSLQLFAAPKPRKPQALIAGLSEAVQNETPLPGVKQEVEQIRSMLPSKVLLNQAFTAKSFKTSAEESPFSIVHLATHGQFSSDPDDTFLLTWDSRINLEQLRTILGNRELEQSTSIDLLILSACQTAQGDRRSAIGLAGVAVRSGASSTLASLWMVNDTSTTSFMIEFYKAFLSSNASSKAGSVRQAQLKLLRQKEFRHPYYWASFVLVGRWI
jgi:CHAT domain-containing protein